MKNTHRLLVSIIGVLLTFSLQANAEGWITEEQNSSQAEIEEAQEALNEKGIQLFDQNENCQLTLSRVVEGRLIITFDGIKKLKKQGEYVLFTFLQTECVGEQDCINFLLEGKVNLNTGQKTVEKMGIEHSSKTDQQGLEAGADQYDYSEENLSNPETQEEKVRNFGNQGKPLNTVRPLIMYTEVATNTLIPSIVCSAGEMSDDEHKPIERQFK